MNFGGCLLWRVLFLGVGRWFVFLKMLVLSLVFEWVCVILSLVLWNLLGFVFFVFLSFDICRNNDDDELFVVVLRL